MAVISKYKVHIMAFMNEWADRKHTSPILFLTSQYNNFSYTILSLNDMEQRYTINVNKFVKKKKWKWNVQEYYVISESE